MRRIYESGAVDRDDDDPSKPNASDERTDPRAARTVPAGTISRVLVPQRLARRAVSVRVSTPRAAYERGGVVPVRIEMRNPLPIPVTIDTRSPVPWSWAVDGHRDASHVPEPIPETDGRFVFDRGERKQFSRRWHGAFRTSETEWEDAALGEHRISVGLSVDDPEGTGLYDETTVRIE